MKQLARIINSGPVNLHGAAGFADVVKSIEEVFPWFSQEIHKAVLPFGLQVEMGVHSNKDAINIDGSQPNFFFRLIRYCTEEEWDQAGEYGSTHWNAWVRWPLPYRRNKAITEPTGASQGEGSSGHEH